MPYIVAERRKRFDSSINKIVEEWEFDYDIGEMNYCLSRIIWKLWEKNLGYETGNELMGVLECVKQEFYRRILAPYEDKKLAENGDIA